jgi:hypothetical protein
MKRGDEYIQYAETESRGDEGYYGSERDSEFEDIARTYGTE